MTGCKVLICAACGYQWNDDKYGSTFAMDCPACDANMVHEYAPDKQEVMGEDFDGMPWY